MALRIAKGLISEQLAKGICSKTALRNCETGKCKPEKCRSRTCHGKKVSEGENFLKNFYEGHLFAVVNGWER
ncbi:MAG: hypothetical protein K2O03_03715 [Lachnospiraceae bacterium]|nr:hypothetical protein [Lachnospiraceae bacterium]